MVAQISSSVGDRIARQGFEGHNHTVRGTAIDAAASCISEPVEMSLEFVAFFMEAGRIVTFPAFALHGSGSINPTRDIVRETSVLASRAESSRYP